MFIAGFGCGFYLRDRIAKKQRPRYLVDPPIVRKAAPSSTKKLVRAPEKMPDMELDKAASPPLLDFKKISMSDELRELLRLLPSDEGQQPPSAKK
jgi:hypothetical protein